jgi:selenide,water dikinase
MLKGSGVAAEIALAAVPLLPGARRLAEKGFAPDGSRRNLEGLRAALRVAPGVSETDLLLLCDAQTSGGLLLAVAEKEAPALVRRLQEWGDPGAARIGRVVPGEPGTIHVAP